MLIKIEKLLPFYQAGPWLAANRGERMDALDQSGIFLPDRQQFHRARYEFACSYVRDKNVADIACGLGYGCRILKSSGAKAAIGIDSCAEAIFYAHSRHQIAGVSFAVGDATQTPLLESSLDSIICFETIEHVPNTEGLLIEFTRILKPEGKLIVSSPNDWGLTEHHCHTWTPFEFLTEIATFFKIESVWEQNSADPTSDNFRRPPGIYPWSVETEHQAECLIVVGQRMAPR